MITPVGDIDITPFRAGSLVQIESKLYMITNFALDETCRVEQTLGGVRIALGIETTIEVSCIATAASEAPGWALNIYGYPEPFKVVGQWYRVTTYDIDHDADTLRVVIQRAYWMPNDN